MSLVLPSHVVITSGRGTGTSGLNAFDRALLDAGVGDLNLLKISSILPAQAKITRLAGRSATAVLPAGTIVPAVYSCCISDTAGEIISACLALGCAAQGCGVIFECSGRGPSPAIRQRTEEMVAEAMQARRRATLRTLSVESECTVPDRGFGCVVAIALLLDSPVMEMPE